MKNKKNYFNYKEKKTIKTKDIYINIFFVLLFLIFVTSNIYMFFPNVFDVFVSFVIRISIFVKAKLWLLFLSFFLINGKFVFKLFIKKLIFILPLGLAKRYFIEKILIKNITYNYLKKLPFNDFFKFLSNKFIKISKTSKIIGFLSFLFSAILGLSFFGDLIIFKILMAKLWSVLLLIFTKLATISYIIIIDTSWIKTFIEILIYGWILSKLEKTKYIGKYIFKIYNLIYNFFIKILNQPIKIFFHYLTIKTSKLMHKTMKTKGYNRYLDFILRERITNKSIYKHLEEYRKIKLNKYKTMVTNPKRQSIYKKNIKNKDKKNIFNTLKNNKKIYDFNNYYLFLHKEHILIK